MSDPQTFEELKRMALELPKKVLVPAHHIHSLLDETERLVERIADLQRQLAEAKERLEGFERAHSIVVNALNKAEAEIEAMQPDADRYKWLRELPNADRMGVRFIGTDLDSVIDEAMKQP